MSITPGWTADEIRDFVYEYERQPWGTKTEWLAGRGVDRDRLRLWRHTVFDGDIDRGLIPRDANRMSSTNRRRFLAKEREHRQRLDEIEKLQARVHELEGTNEALGKAIGLLHELNEQGPGASPTNDPTDS